MSNHNIIITNTGAESTLTLSGSLTVARITEIKEAFDRALGNSQKLNIKASNIDSIDLTFVQLILSLKKLCQQKGIELTTNIDLNPEQTQLLQRAGIKLN